MDNDEIPRSFLDTPHGRLYRPPGEWWQILVLVAAFFGGPALGWLVGQIPGDLSDKARTVLYVPYVAIFFLGYAACMARLNAIAFDTIGRSLLKALFLLIVRRQRPKSAEDVLPSREKLLEMAVRAQKAGAAFGPASWPVAILAGLIATMFDSATGSLTLLLLVAFTCLAWGYLLARLGRWEWLPFMEKAELDAISARAAGKGQVNQDARDASVGIPAVQPRRHGGALSPEPSGGKAEHLKLVKKDMVARLVILRSGQSVYPIHKAQGG